MQLCILPLSSDQKVFLLIVFQNTSLKACLKTVEAIRTAIWALTYNRVNRHSMENNSLQKSLTSWMDFPLVFACHISSVILTDIILTVLETEYFLSNSTMHMLILASGPE
jgi:hypothetical protein